MKQEMSLEDSIFLKTVVGVLLLIAAMGLWMAILAKVYHSGFIYTLATAFAGYSFLLLFRAIREDRKRAGTVGKAG